MGKLVPFNLPYVPEAAKKFVLAAQESGHPQGDVPFTAKAPKTLSAIVGGAMIS
jgi:hypothetical protein